MYTSLTKNPIFKYKWWDSGGAQLLEVLMTFSWSHSKSFKLKSNRRRVFLLLLPPFLKCYLSCFTCIFTQSCVVRVCLPLLASFTWLFSSLSSWDNILISFISVHYHLLFVVRAWFVGNAFSVHMHYLVKVFVASIYRDREMTVFFLFYPCIWVTPNALNPHNCCMQIWPILHNS